MPVRKDYSRKPKLVLFSVKLLHYIGREQEMDKVKIRQLETKLAQKEVTIARLKRRLDRLKSLNLFK